MTPENVASGKLNDTCLTHQDLFLHLRKQGDLHPRSRASQLHLLVLIKKNYEGENWDSTYEEKVKKCIMRYTVAVKRLWEKSSRKLSSFQSNNQNWLSKEFQLPANIKNHGGRPEKKFEDSCARSKRQKIKSVVNSIDSEELNFAVQYNLNKKGHRAASKIVETIVKKPDTALEIKNIATKIDKFKPIPIIRDQALAFILDNNLTKQQYVNIRLMSKKHNADIYPPYDDILTAKKQCYPKKIEITESQVKIPLQNLLDHTVHRILQSISLENMPMSTLEMFYKWGCDGSSGHAQYKQKFENIDDSDKDLFLISLVPLKLVDVNATGKQEIIWSNPRACSTRFCRPIKFVFQKETKEFIQKEVELMNDEISNLSSTISDQYGAQLEIKHTLIFSMIDGKVCNSVTNTSSQKCYICGCGPKEMNQISLMYEGTVNLENCSFGLSTLHAWIRTFECLLHISYRLDFKKWQARSDEEKEMLKNRKTMIQNKFRSELGLLVDVVLQGHGTTNDGNTARRFFENAAKSSEITGLDIKLLENFAVILRAMASGQNINIEKFREFSKDTAKMYIYLYPWYYMPATVHKILIHGADVIQYALLPIGLLSEEAQEARNKEYKRYREHHTRKSSRLNTNTDVIHRLLETSDPYISSIRKSPPKRKSILCERVKALLIIDESDEMETDQH